MLKGRIKGGRAVERALRVCPCQTRTLRARVCEASHRAMHAPVDLLWQGELHSRPHWWCHMDDDNYVVCTPLPCETGHLHSARASQGRTGGYHTGDIRRVIRTAGNLCLWHRL